MATREAPKKSGMKRAPSPYAVRRRRNLVTTESAEKAKAVTPLPGKGPEPKGPPTGAELEYRTRLQSAILHITRVIMEERREEIILRAQERLKFEDSLRTTELEEARLKGQAKKKVRK